MKLNVLAIDPSLREFGLSVISEGKVLHGYCIKTDPKNKKLRIRKGDDNVRRVSEINEVLLSTLIQYDINYIVSELPSGTQSASAATALGLAIGIVQTAAMSFDIGIDWYSEGDAKKCLLGKTSAEKIEVFNAIHSKYKFAWPKAQYKRYAIADSLAVYHVARKNSAVLKTFL